MENCSGQNKNNMVLRLALFLVEAKYFKKVTFMFYIVGHTKKCGRLVVQYVEENITAFEPIHVRTTASIDENS